MKMEVYKPEEIIHVIQLLETVQDMMAAQIENAEFMSTEAWDMLQEAIEVLYYEEDEE